jgi:Asp-tRNA(Asn)/Glu-tRNA(Gln) amidotransferase A subunit family amidase
MSLLDCPLGAQAKAIAAGEADPTELLEQTLARFEQRNPALNAVIATFPEQSREMLREAPDGPLHGVPVVIKDEWPLPWRAQQFGASRSFAAFEPGESGVYRALRDAGAVIAGVANMHELGSSSTGNTSVYGPAHNPWDLERCPGGSSSGPGSAVGGRLVAAAVGADGIGSIRYPAAYCGVTGLKPTFGRSAMEGHHLAPVTTTIVSGPLATDAAGCRLLGSVLFGEELPAGDAAGLRIGVVRGPISEDCQPAVREACEAAIEALRAETGGEVTEVDPDGLDLSGIASILVGSTESVGAITPGFLNAVGDELSIVNRALLKYRLLLPHAAVARAELMRAHLRRSLAGVFEQVDVLAWPTVPAVAPPLTEPVVELPSGLHSADEVNPRGGGLANLTGTPAVSVPVGFGEGGLPIGLQLEGAWGSDALLLDAAEALERATERRWVDALPPIAEPLSTQEAEAAPN